VVTTAALGSQKRYATAEGQMSISIWQSHPLTFKLHQMFNMMFTPMFDPLASALPTSVCICECFGGVRGA